MSCMFRSWRRSVAVAAALVLPSQAAVAQARRIGCGEVELLIKKPDATAACIRESVTLKTALMLQPRPNATRPAGETELINNELKASRICQRLEIHLLGRVDNKGEFVPEGDIQHISLMGTPFVFNAATPEETREIRVAAANVGCRRFTVKYSVDSATRTTRKVEITQQCPHIENAKGAPDDCTCEMSTLLTDIEINARWNTFGKKQVLVDVRSGRIDDKGKATGVGNEVALRFPDGFQPPGLDCCSVQNLLRHDLDVIRVSFDPPDGTTFCEDPPHEFKLTVDVAPSLPKGMVLIIDGEGVFVEAEKEQKRITPRLAKESVKVRLKARGQVTVRALRPEGTTEHECGSARYFLILLVNVDWEAIDSSLTADPNLEPGVAGVRIFPDAATPTQAMEVPRKQARVRVIVESDPKVTGAKIAARVVDVDDPSGSDFSLDFANDAKRGRGEGNPKAEGTADRVDKVQDNHGIFIPREGGLKAVKQSPLGGFDEDKDPPKTEITLENGMGKAVFVTTFTPGDNFRAVATCSADSEEAFKALLVLQGIVVIEGEKMNGEKGDRAMIVRLDRKTKKFTPVDIGRGAPKAMRMSPLLTVWRKPRIEVDRMKRPAAGDELTTDADLFDATGLKPPDLSLMVGPKNIYRRAFLEFEELDAGLNADNLIDFRLRTGSLTEDLIEEFKKHRNVQNTVPFWNIHLISAFRDSNPGSIGPAESERTLPNNTSLIYLKAIKSSSLGFARFLPRVTAHESAHQFGVADNTGCIMSPSIERPGPDGERFCNPGAQFDQIRVPDMRNTKPDGQFP